MHEFQAISILGGGAIAFVVAWMLAAGLIPSPLAQPNARSLHIRPVPRIGGVAIWAGWLAAWAAVPGSWQWAAPLALVVTVSLIDDFRALPSTVRLLAHAAAAILAAATLLDAGWLFLAFAVLAMVWMANLYNFMDGADGLAGSMGLFGFGAYGVAAAVAGRAESGVLFGTLAAACAGFLVFNRPPARLFMGDVGAVGLGFLAGLFGLQGIVAGAWPWWFPPLVFAPFILDATATLLRRLRQRAPLASAHRDHFYQRAILVDGTHGPTVRAYIGWMAGCAILALVGLIWVPAAGGLLLLAACAGFAWHCRAIEQRWSDWSRIQHAG